MIVTPGQLQLHPAQILIYYIYINGVKMMMKSTDRFQSTYSIIVVDYLT